ncbi:MAG: ABC transporter permease [Oscillospiraceae bacterium]|nr:ABC transporter permease [Oscillospiraceae bacterium]
MKVKRILRLIVGNEKQQAYTVPLLAILCSLIVSSILLLFMGRNPITAFQSILAGAGVLPRPNYAGGRGMFTDIMMTLSELTPMIFASLAVTVAFKGGLFNIGISGQMLFSGFIATVLIGYSELPSYIAMPLVIIIGTLCGAFIGALIGLLKAKFNINEVVSSIMLNYIIMYIISFFIQTRFIDPITRQSVEINSSARLVLQNVQVGPYRAVIPFFIILAIAAAFALRFFLNRTRAGFDLRAVGLNSRAARYLGIKPQLNIMVAMIISGALAGLAGVTHYLGFQGAMPTRELVGTGFDAIAVALLGNVSPIGSLFASVLITIISRGTTYMSSILDVQREIAQVITGFILLFSACGAFIKQVVNTSDVVTAEPEADDVPTEEGE